MARCSLSIDKELEILHYLIYYRLDVMARCPVSTDKELEILHYLVYRLESGARQSTSLLAKAEQLWKMKM